jgi:hypothetical protein
MTSTETEQTRAHARDRTRWLPLGLWLAGLLALLRSSTIFALAHREVELATSQDSWRFLGRVIAAYPDVLTQSLIVGLVIGALALRSAEAVNEDGRPQLASLPYVFCSLLVLSLLSGWPLAEGYQTSRFFAEFAVDDVAVLACFSAIAVGLAFVVATWLLEVDGAFEQRGIRWLFVGRRALLLALVLAVLLPASLAWLVSTRTTGWEQAQAPIDARTPTERRA